jgi:hypothetical protein
MIIFSDLQFYMLFIFWRIGNMGVSKMKAKGMQATFASLEEEKEKIVQCPLGTCWCGI